MDVRRVPGGLIAEPNHFGRPVLVTQGRRLDDDREIVSSALLDVSRGELMARLGDQQLAPGDAARRRIDEVIVDTVVKGSSEIVDQTQLG